MNNRCVKILTVILLSSAFSVLAQTARESIGFAGGGSGAENWTPELQKRLDDQTALQLLDGHIYRKIDGKVYNLFESGTSVYGDVEATENGIIILQKAHTQSIERFALRNYNGDATDGKSIGARAIRDGTYNWGDIPVELWDCGTLLTPQEEQEKLNEIQNALDAKKKAKDEETRRNNFIIQSNAIVHLQSFATNGEMWAQTSLGLYYLNGQGCETNKELGVFWLKKAAAQGDEEASNKLVSLKIP